MEPNGASVLNNKAHNSAATAKSGKSYNLGSLKEVILKNVPYHMQDFMEAHFQKELRSPDTSSVRLVSLEDGVTRLANTQTISLSLMEANGVERVTDFQHRWRERLIGTDTVPFFNPNGDFPGETESNRPVNDNTLGFIGSRSNVRFIAEELYSQSPIAPGADLAAEELEDILIRIRRKQNASILVNTEIKAENSNVVPQYGGYVTRSTLNGLSTSGDLTNAIIQGRVNAIAAATSAQGLTHNVQLMALTGINQIAKVDDLMMARPSAQSSEDQMAQVARLSAGLPFTDLAAYQMAVYKPRPGLPILFIYEPDLPSGYTIFFEPKGEHAPKLGRFQMQGMMGPWALERPEANLIRVTYVWDALTVIDKCLPSRSVVTGLN